MFVDADTTMIEPTIERWIETTVLIWIGVFRSILAKRSEKRVLDDVITVTADIDVRKRLQLNRIPDSSELRRVSGATFRCRIHTSLSYRFRRAENTFKAGNMHDVRLMNRGYGKIGKRYA